MAEFEQITVVDTTTRYLNIRLTESKAMHIVRALEGYAEVLHNTNVPPHSNMMNMANEIREALRNGK